MRNQCLAIRPEEFLTDPKYANKNVWDLLYISTSDEEDNDSSEEEEDKSGEGSEEEESSGEEEDSEEKEERKQKSAEKEYKKIWKEDEYDGKGEKIPDIAKKLRPSKKKERVYYTYS